MMHEPQLEYPQRPTIESASLEVVQQWITELKQTRPQKEWWELIGVIDGNVPGFERVDDALVMKVDGRMIGAALLAHTDPPALIGAFVHPQYRTAGYGRQLIEGAIQRLLAGGAKKVLLEVCDSRALSVVQKLPEEILSRLDIRDVRRDD